MKKAFSVVAILTALVLAPSIATATPIDISGIGTLGSFEGTFDFSASNDNNGVVTVVLTNTSPAANGGYITAFAFNLPDDVIVTSATLSPPASAAFGVLGGPDFDNDVNGQPNGNFDIGASTGNSYEGGGNPNDGIAVGDTVTFTFTLEGSGFDSISVADFLAALSVPHGQGGGGGQEEKLEDFVVRFRGFENGGSDKVPNDNPPDEDVPEPGTMLLVGLGVAALITSRVRRPRS